MRSVSVGQGPKLLAAVAMVCAFSGAAWAQGPASKHRSTPPLPQPRLAVSLQPPVAGSSLWRLVVTNQDRVPVRLAADARNMTLLVRLPETGKYQECALPSAMLGSWQERQLFLPPGARYEEPFDIRLYCWGKVDEPLPKDSSVTAFLGWRPSSKRWAPAQDSSKAPFLVQSGTEPSSRAALKYAVSLTAWPKPFVQEPKPASISIGEPSLSQVPLELTTTRFIDAASHKHISISATVKNISSRAVTVHLRPDDLILSVLRPDGHTVQCNAFESERAAVRDFFQHLGPGQSYSMQMLLSELCPADTFEQEGLYQAFTTLRTQQTGEDFHLKAVTGDFVAKRPSLIRVQQAPQPLQSHAPQVTLPQH